MIRGKILALKQVRVKVIAQLEQRKVKLHSGPRVEVSASPHDPR